MNELLKDNNSINLINLLSVNKDRQCFIYFEEIDGNMSEISDNISNALFHMNFTTQFLMLNAEATWNSWLWSEIAMNDRELNWGHLVILRLIAINVLTKTFYKSTISIPKEGLIDNYYYLLAGREFQDVVFKYVMVEKTILNNEQ